MSKKATPGGIVRISGKAYTVIEGPKRHGDTYRIMVRSEQHFGAYWATAEDWRVGRGPWKISGPVVGDEA